MKKHFLMQARVDGRHMGGGARFKVRGKHHQFWNKRPAGHEAEEPTGSMAVSKISQHRKFPNIETKFLTFCKSCLSKQFCKLP